MTEAEKDARIAELESRLHDAEELTLRLFQVHTGQRVNELRLRALVEKIVARHGGGTRSKQPHEL